MQFERWVADRVVDFAEHGASEYIVIRCNAKSYDNAQSVLMHLIQLFHLAIWRHKVGFKW